MWALLTQYLFLGLIVSLYFVSSAENQRAYHIPEYLILILGQIPVFKAWIHASKDKFPIENCPPGRAAEETEVNEDDLEAHCSEKMTGLPWRE